MEKEFKLNVIVNERTEVVFHMQLSNMEINVQNKKIK